ncbi:DUF4834 family protein [Xanthovirga aplysinae]|uniref:DUF4834 family protein n=1 Tax=Xanthovirga aplysinae TaxID=2529853 RepID=UPI0012BD36C2|nr:DUF4834 family protein [Xanthovirga aplysinae]MTI32431.1 DUF4834 family protein [Xanthovirga aplysinae]
MCSITHGSHLKFKIITMKVFLIILLLFYLLIRLSSGIMRFIYRLLGHQVRQYNSGNQNAHFHKQSSFQKEGDIKIQYKPEKKSKDAQSFKGGDYIDYEELKD